MAVEPQRGGEGHVRRNIKDTVFTSMFSIPEYALELYRALHPEDAETQAEDIELVTLEPVIAAGVRNDLGFTVGDRVLVLMEAQSTWTKNIAMRMMVYAAKTYLGYAEAKGLNLYGGRSFGIPRPEMYIVYTGGASSVPKILSLRDDILGGTSDIEVSIRVLREEAPGIIGEYVAFARLWDTIRSRMGNTPAAAKELVRECLARGILAGYIATRQVEVADMLVRWNDQEEIDRLMREEARREGLEEGEAKGKAEGLEQGLEQGRLDVLALVAGQLKLSGATVFQAVETLVSVYGMSLPGAEKLVAEHWK